MAGALDCCEEGRWFEASPLPYLGSSLTVHPAANVYLTATVGKLKAAMKRIDHAASLTFTFTALLVIALCKYF